MRGLGSVLSSPVKSGQLPELNNFPSCHRIQDFKWQSAFIGVLRIDFWQMRMYGEPFICLK
jgi:hypothetical protein